MTVRAEQVLDFLGRPGDTSLSGTVEQAIPIITTMVRAYTRGKGFTEAPFDDDAEPDLEGVIIAAAARLATNPGQLQVDETAGPFSRSLRNSFVGWTIAEQTVLNRYRVRAQ